MSDVKATPGPWRWELNLQSKTIQLVGGKPQFDKTVMDFTRWGLGGAAPRFNEAIAGNEYNIMSRVHEKPEWIKLFPKRKHHASWCVAVDHPDAHMIMASRSLYDALESLFGADMERVLMGDGKDDQIEAIKKARAAMERARGEA